MEASDNKGANIRDLSQDQKGKAKESSKRPSNKPQPSGKDEANLVSITTTDNKPAQRRKGSSNSIISNGTTDESATSTSESQPSAGGKKGGKSLSATQVSHSNDTVTLPAIESAQKKKKPTKKLNEQMNNALQTDDTVLADAKMATTTTTTTTTTTDTDMKKLPRGRPKSGNKTAEQTVTTSATPTTTTAAATTTTTTAAATTAKAVDVPLPAPFPEPPSGKQATQILGSNDVPAIETKPKPKRGRPPKNLQQASISASNVTSEAQDSKVTAAAVVNAADELKQIPQEIAPSKSSDASATAKELQDPQKKTKSSKKPAAEVGGKAGKAVTDDVTSDDSEMDIDHKAAAKSTTKKGKKSAQNDTSKDHDVHASVSAAHQPTDVHVAEGSDDDVDVLNAALHNMNLADRSDVPPYPKEFTAITVGQVPQYNAADDTYTWGRVTYSVEQWRIKLDNWLKIYPNITIKVAVTNRKGITSMVTSNTHELVTFRSKQTTSKKVISDCWEKLPKTNKHIKSSYSDIFRVDMYNNVVSIQASDGAICKFDVDHIFPWSRGGLSVNQNFAGVQCVANRTVKNDDMVQFLDPQQMNCGIRPQQFEALINYAEAKARDSGGGRRDVAFSRDLAFRWLLDSPKNGQMLTNFQELVGGSEDGRVLWDFFERNELIQRGLMPATDMKPEQPIRRQLGPPTVHLRYQNNLIECFGSETYQIKDLLKHQCKMTWDHNRSCWWKRCVEETERAAFIQLIKDTCGKEGITVSY